MCAQTDGKFTPTQEEFINSFVEVLQTEQANFDAEQRWTEVTDRTVEEDPSVETGIRLVEEAIQRSGLGEDSHAVKRARRANDTALQVLEATANGMSADEARLMVALGLDPRAKDPLAAIGGEAL